MKSCTRLAVVAATCLIVTVASSAVAADGTKLKTVDPSGTWRWEFTRNNGETVKNELRIDMDDKREVVATYHGLMDGLKATKGSVDGDKLVLDFDVERDEFSFKAKYDATIKDDTATGTITVSGDQGSQEFPWEAKRSVELSDVVGTWKLEIETRDGETHEATLDVKKADAGYTAAYHVGQFGEFPAKDLKADGNTLSFVVAGNVDGNDFEAKFKSHPKGSRIKGGVDVAFGDNTVEMTLSGKRVSNK